MACPVAHKNESLNTMIEFIGSKLEYVVQAFKVLKNLVPAEANARA